MSEDAPTIPTKPAGRPSKAALDERVADLDAREADLRKLQEQIQTATNLLEARVSTDEVRVPKDGENPKAVRKSMGQAKRLDADKYLEIHQDKQLLWINDLDGDVQRWIDAGAEPVPLVTSRDGRVFEGITDRADSKWVRAIAGDDGFGNHFYAYLLMIDFERYEEIKVGPERDRRQEIRRAMRIGGDQSTGADGSQVGGSLKLPTYPANLPGGAAGQGIDETRESV